MKIRNKVDLHLHIDGAANPKTVYQITHREHIAPECSMTLEEITRSMVIQPGEYDPDYLCFLPPQRAMQTADSIARITRELVEWLEREEVIYAELRYAPQYHLAGGLTQRDTVEAVLQGLREGLASCRRLTAQVILCAMNTGDPHNNRAENLETVRLAAAYLGKGVCAVDLAGYEEDMPGFAELFRLADKLGVPATTHSEFTVKDALAYGTPRIGHGYQAALDPELTREVIRRGVTLEMCPQSSLSYEYGLRGDETHPLRRLFLAGAKVTVNTDNPVVLNTCLEHEYDLCRQMGFTDREIVAMNNNAIRAAFLPESEKARLLAVQPDDSL